MKIIGVGFNKTGTTTLHKCCNVFGFKHKTFSPTMCKYYFDGNLQAIYKVLDNLDSVEDWPWALMFKELDQRYSDAKFILTVRKDSEAWWSSLEKHLKIMSGVFPGMDQKIFGFDNPLKHKDEMIQKYEQHNQDVKKHFEGRPEKLLKVCWEKGDGWKELCEFLNLEIPSSPFPHENKTPKITIKKRIFSLFPYEFRLKIKKLLRIK